MVNVLLVALICAQRVTVCKRVGTLAVHHGTICIGFAVEFSWTLQPEVLEVFAQLCASFDACGLHSSAETAAVKGKSEVTLAC